MKAIKLLTGILILTFNYSLAQDLSAEDRKVQIFTYEEKANLQTWYNEELQRMNFSEEEESQYNSILYYYIAKIARLDDKDKDFTEAEFKAKLNEYLAKQEADLKEILSPEQMDIHRDIYGEFLRSAYKRWGIEQ